MIEWLNQNEGIANIILALCTIFLSVIAIIISLSTARVQNKISLLHNRIDAVNALETFCMATNHALDCADAAESGSQTPPPIPPFDRFRAILTSDNGQRVAKSLYDELSKMQEQQKGQPKSTMQSELCTQRINQIVGEILLSEFAYISSIEKRIRQAEYIFSKSSFPYIESLSSAVVEHFLSGGCKGELLREKYENFTKADILKKMKVELNIKN